MISLLKLINGIIGIDSKIDAFFIDKINSFLFEFNLVFNLNSGRLILGVWIPFLKWNWKLLIEFNKFSKNKALNHFF